MFANKMELLGLAPELALDTPAHRSRHVLEVVDSLTSC